MRYMLRLNGKIIPNVTEIKPHVVPDFWSGRKEIKSHSKSELITELNRILAFATNTDVIQIKLLKEGGDP